MLVLTLALYGDGLVHDLVLVDEQAAEHSVGGPQSDQPPRMTQSGLLSGLMRSTSVHGSEDWSEPSQFAPP